jgi:L,D-transpeptidase YcbB
MRALSSVAILGVAGATVAAAVLSVGAFADKPPRTGSLTASVVIEITDIPVLPPPWEAAALASPQPMTDEAPVAEPAPPQPSAIVDVIRTRLEDLKLRKSAPSEDLVALEAFYADRSDPSLWMSSAGFSPQAKAVIEEIGKADDWGLDSAAFTLPQVDAVPVKPEEQADAEISLDLAILKYARFARGGRANPDAISQIFDQKPALRDPKEVLTAISASDVPDAYLRSLQPQAEQFQRLHEALVKARADGKSGDLKRLIVNMERWRWMPEHLGAFYVWLNIPEFMVHVVKNGKVTYSEKIVVGELAYATPVFSANMTSIVFNPEWTVPPTIVRENLLPKLRSGGGWFSSNTEILKQHELKVYYNGREVDPSRIDWNRVNMGAISFTQAPGPRNVLGKVKFLYPNSHSVYLHDTIKRDLFDLTVRAKGHNCPRVANPGKFAGVLLAEDKGWDWNKIEELLAKGYNTAIGLMHPIPVHTTYFTALVGDDGKVQTFDDVYKLDGLVAAAVIGKGVRPQRSEPGASEDMATSTTQ